MNLNVNIIPFDKLDKKVEEMINMLYDDNVDFEKTIICRFRKALFDSSVIVNDIVYNKEELSGIMFNKNMHFLNIYDWDNMIDDCIPVFKRSAAYLSSLHRIKKYYDILDDIMDQIKIFQLIQRGIIEI